MKAAMLAIMAVLALVASTDAFSSFTPGSSSLSFVSNGGSMSMKIFDWKRREADESDINDLDNSNSRSTISARLLVRESRKKRKGRGIAADRVRRVVLVCVDKAPGVDVPSDPGFEGGQTPLYRRLPKFVGKPTGPGHKKTVYNIIKLDQLNGVEEGATTNFDSLLESKAVTKSKYGIHKVVVGREDFTAKGITVQAHAFTKTAREAIEAAGGKCELLKRTTGEVIEA